MCPSKPRRILVIQSIAESERPTSISHPPVCAHDSSGPQTPRQSAHRNRPPVVGLDQLPSPHVCLPSQPGSAAHSVRSGQGKQLFRGATPILLTAPYPTERAHLRQKRLSSVRSEKMASVEQLLGSHPATVSHI